jgi:glycosyltransferase involved in cell wall biosynthesis
MAGYRVAIARDIPVKHGFQRSIAASTALRTQDPLELKASNAAGVQRFKEKWGHFDVHGLWEDKVTQTLGPLVSCLMPTYNRREFIVRAFQSFQNQTYLNRELIVLDDGTDNIAKMVPCDTRIRYYRHDGPRQNYGEKINACAKLATGEFFVIWDDDDYYSPTRIGRQIEPLLNGFDLSGTSKIFYDNQAGHRWLFNGNPARWLGAIAFKRSLWEQQQFQETNIGPDTIFQNYHRKTAKFYDIADPELLIATIHNNNTCPKNTSNKEWEKIW